MTPTVKHELKMSNTKNHPRLWKLVIYTYISTQEKLCQIVGMHFIYMPSFQYDRSTELKTQIVTRILQIHQTHRGGIRSSVVARWTADQQVARSILH